MNTKKTIKYIYVKEENVHFSVFQECERALLNS